MVKNIKSTEEPKISVLMPVYNASEYLSTSIENILNQTFKDFEFIIIDDGSSDKSKDIIKNYQTSDDRIRLITHKINQGLVSSLNEGVGLAKAKYIARQDADDISEINRLEKQFNYLEKNKNIGLVGSNYYVIDKNGNKLFSTDVFTHFKDLRLAEIFINQFGHGSVLMRKDAVRKAGLYKKRISEDTDLWTRMMHISDLANLKENLYCWRSAGEGLSTNPEKFERLKEDAYKIRDREFDIFIRNKKMALFFSFHPLSTSGGFKKYLESKSVIYRNMALLYADRGYRMQSKMAAIIAMIHAPWNTKNLVLLIDLLLKKELRIEYEYF